jgi:uncharacterized caspase-like protein
VNDAIDVAVVLKKLGFEVVEGRDLDEAGMRAVVKRFAGALAGADVGLFFYAGHGLQALGQNYLVPVDAKLESAAGLDFEVTALDVIHRTMERETKTNVIFLDACRDNPLSRNLARAMGSRSYQVGKGLAPVESGVGTLISFSTQPGNVALDGQGRNSPFTASLLKHISNPKDDLSKLLIKVRNDVMAATKDHQIPWEHSALRAKFYFAAPRVPSDEDEELTLWKSLSNSTNAEELTTYLARYPEGEFASIARARLERLKAEEAAREEERSRAEELKASAEIKRLASERQARDAAFEAARKSAEQAKNDVEDKRLDEQRQVEEAAHTAELNKVLEEARIAREATKEAQKQRQAALKAAEEAARQVKTPECGAGKTLVGSRCVSKSGAPAKRDAAAPKVPSGGPEMCRSSGGWVLPCGMIKDPNKSRQ